MDCYRTFFERSHFQYLRLDSQCFVDLICVRADLQMKYFCLCELKYIKVRGIVNTLF